MPSSTDTAGWTLMSNTSDHSRANGTTGANSVAEKMETTCISEEVGHYSAISRMSAGYASWPGA